MSMPCLLVIDVQEGFNDPQFGKRNNPDAEKNISLLINKWREKSYPIIHIQHLSTNEGSPLHKESPGSRIKREAMPLKSELVIAKNVNSAFIGTDLEKHLRRKKISHLVIVGLTTDHCVSTTTRMAGNLGFDVVLVSDSTATFDRKDIDGNMIPAEEMHRINLASLNNEFCTIKDTKDLLG